MKRSRPLPSVELVTNPGEGVVCAVLRGHMGYPGGVRVMGPDAIGNAILMYSKRMCRCEECDACLVRNAFLPSRPS